MTTESWVRVDARVRVMSGYFTGRTGVVRDRVKGSKRDWIVGLDNRDTDLIFHQLELEPETES